MLLRNLRSIPDNNNINILIEDDKISSVSNSTIQTEGIVLDFDNAIVFPGLINSHDHLDFNLFPRIANRKYDNYIEWGNDIHQHNKQQIDKVTKIPIQLRILWGIYKNLLCGVTTVVNHGDTLTTDNELITVFQRSYVLHSPGFEKNILFKLNNPFSKGIVNIHVGEGTDDVSKREINKLIRWNLLNKKLIGVHGIAMDAEQAKKFYALVWCPDSNYFLIDKTAEINELKKNTVVLFGTDSTLTANWNIWNHLKLARKTELLNDMELFDSITVNAAKAWRLCEKGLLQKGYDADIVVANDNKIGMNSFYDVNPEDILLVMHRGHIRLCDETISRSLPQNLLNNFSRININGKNKFVEGDLQGLIQKIKTFYPEADLPLS
jgi:cytosine/adenosine deaminase-related metal-dependent hydrolase